MTFVLGILKGPFNVHSTKMFVKALLDINSGVFPMIMGWRNAFQSWQNMGKKECRQEKEEKESTTAILTCQLMFGNAWWCWLYWTGLTYHAVVKTEIEKWRVRERERERERRKRRKTKYRQILHDDWKKKQLWQHHLGPWALGPCNTQRSSNQRKLPGPQKPWR